MKTILVLRCLFLPLLIGAVISCNSPADKPQKDQRKSEAGGESATDLGARLEKTNKAIERAMLAGDYEAILSYYTDDVVLVPDFQPAVRGKSAVWEGYTKQQKAGVTFHSFSATTEKIWTSGKDVYEYGTFGQAVSARDHAKPKAYYGSYFMIWEEQPDGALLIKYVIWNLGFNPCGD
jgi:ketosteroid isomerase-like protein